MIVQRHILSGALRAAAEVYTADAALFSRLATEAAKREDLAAPMAAALAYGHARTATAFAAQAVEARKLASEIEQADTIQLL
jgi:hypothetical protein